MSNMIKTAKQDLLFVVGLQLALASLAVAQVCQTEDCTKLSSQISSNLQQSADPCTDFYQYACGSWSAAHPLKSDVIQYSQSSVMHETMQSRLQGLIEEEIKSDDPSAVKAAKEQYKACMDVDGLNAKGVAPLVNVLNGLGGLPMATENFEASKTWKEVHDLYLKKTGRGALYFFFVGTSAPRSSKNALYLDQADYVTREYEETSVGATFVQYLTNVTLKIAEATGSTVPRATIEAEAQKVLQFKIALEQLKNPDIYRRPNESVTLTEVDNAVGNGKLNFLSTVQLLFQDIEGVTINGDVKVNVYEWDYLKNLTKLIDNTDQKIILNYIHYHFLSKYAVYSTSEINAYLNEMFVIEQIPRAQFCIDEPNLKHVLASMYVRRYSSQKEKTEATNLVNDLKKIVEAQLKRTAWVSSVQTAAVEKLQNMAQNIAYSDWYTDVQSINTYYAQYNMGSDILQNVLNYQEVKFKQHLSVLQETNNLANERVSARLTVPISINPTYNWRYNRLDVPAGNLQLPYFSTNSVLLANYGAFGSEIAYLLYSLYDELGIKYDDQGRPITWFNSTDAYKAKHNCFVDQYKGYKVKELDDAGIKYKIRVPRFILTPMASFGVKVALEAYEEKVKQGAADQLLPNLDNISKQKQFFLAYANTFCDTTNVQEFVRGSNNQIHIATTRLRLNFAVSNSLKFSEAFNCPAGSPMNPAVKCSLLD